MSTLLAAALIECDGERPPIKLFAPVFVAGCAATIFFVGVWPAPVWPYAREGLLGPEAAIAGVFVGALLGGLLAILCRADADGLVGCLAVVGLVLSLQAVCYVALATAAIGLSMKALSRRPLPWTVWLALGALAWIIAWGSLNRIFPQFS